jgi:hypothetical protein
MRCAQFLTTLTSFLFLPPLSAADLTRIERKIGREPAYESKPRYCLLVFGPHAKTRVWLVQDGHNLYVDRNGNGDLTDDGEKIAAKKSGQPLAAGGDHTFEVGDIRDGALTHKSLRVRLLNRSDIINLDAREKEFWKKNPKGHLYDLRVQVEMPGRKGAGVGGRVQQEVCTADIRGFLQFAESAKDAPIVHFGGPWQITLSCPHRAAVGREFNLSLSVGTPGLGTGTTTDVAYERLIPENAHPTVEITYPAEKKGCKPVKERYELKERC